ncbi:hypothetical protein SAMN04490182_4904 [Pseudomonas cedrina]|uniref:Uncharacterized protein n=1 Tax=Pseudomonas cedrina TaxID=651740 RepID=A0ABY0V0X5_PSECE|nr:hypothetical protein [Pseudomonas cedrina]SDT48377.1 hypothetical protein SAMN04490182_4904 [Pseudomonas cedrina]
MRISLGQEEGTRPDMLARGAENVGAGLLANAVCQSQMF